MSCTGFFCRHCLSLSEPPFESSATFFFPRVHQRAIPRTMSFRSSIPRAKISTANKDNKMIIPDMFFSLCLDYDYHRENAYL